MRQISSAAAILCMIAAGASPALAQVNAALEPGARVRLITPRLDATQQMVKVVHVTADSVEFRSEGYPVSRKLAIADIGAIEVKAPGHRPFVRNMLIGGGVGAVLGGAMAYASYKESDCSYICLFETSRTEEATLGGVGGATLGIVAGAGIAAFQTGDRWTRIPLNANVAFVPVRGGRFALTIKRSL